MPRIPINIAELVGETPLVGLPGVLGEREREAGVGLFAKLEAANPGAA
jgi:cysteine synthase